MSSRQKCSLDHPGPVPADFWGFLVRFFPGIRSKATGCPIECTTCKAKGGIPVGSNQIYEDIALRTGGDIYIGVVGPVRTGKSTFIKRFMETLVLPNIENAYRRERAIDELPQSGSGRTIMTAEPKFVPEEAIEIALNGGATMRVRLVDCVGYMVPGALGHFEDDLPRMVSTPWFDHEIPMAEAAEMGTRKVIEDHSTIGIVVTTDGSVTDIPREDYVDAERRVITELKEQKKPFVILVNSAYPQSPQAQTLARELQETYDITAIPVNCMELEEQDIAAVLNSMLMEFPMTELGVFLPSWVDALPTDHPIKQELFDTLRANMEGVSRIREVQAAVEAIAEAEAITGAKVLGINLATGVAAAQVDLPRSMFYETLSQQSGFDITDDGDLVTLLSGLSQMKEQYDRVSAALDSVSETGYGIVMPTLDQMKLEEPEIVKQAGRYGVRLKASAPSIHMIRADIETEVSPIVGNEKQSEEMVNFLLQEFEGDTAKIWQSNIFGKSFHELVSEDLHTKLLRMPDDARSKLQETLTRIINEGSGGLICIIL